MTKAAVFQINIEYHSGIPVYRQIVQAVTAGVDSGALGSGDRLPTIRELSRQLKINPNTVAKAYRELELKQLLETNGRRGSQISDQRPVQQGLTKQQKQQRLQEIYARSLAEAHAMQISEDELRAYFAQKNQEEH